MRIPITPAVDPGVELAIVVTGALGAVIVYGPPASHPVPFMARSHTQR